MLIVLAFYPRGRTDAANDKFVDHCLPLRSPTRPDDIFSTIAAEGHLRRRFQ
jgi:hypothetical protein